MIDIIEIAKKYFTVTEKEVDPEFKVLKSSKMTAEANQYIVEGLGNMTFQNAKAMFGLMKMEMVCITPLNRDLPLISCDIVDVLGNYTFIFELYDVMLDKDDKLNVALNAIKADYENLPDTPLEEHWYDSIRLDSSVSKKAKKKVLKVPCDELATKYFETIFAMAKEMPEVSDVEAKREASDAYVNGLLTQGGAATKVFFDTFGEEKTTEYFKKVIFGTAK
ncbi:MAG: hypothetical protein MJ143_05790 [Clostridia bacterium]|nr:hypothetical protein [Clostridia bacterium]